MKCSKKISLVLLVLTICIPLFSQAYNQDTQKQIYTEKQQQLRITDKDIRLIPETDPEKGGYHLYVRKLPNINSIMLTETTKDPLGKNPNYAYRAKEYNPINGDEIRYLDGKQLVSEGAKYSLVDSTLEDTDFFGPAFHIYIPPVLVYGYPWSRTGEVELGHGTFVNIRAFEKPYGDYESGDFMDNPFMFNFVPKKRKKPAPKPKPVIKPAPEPDPLPEPFEEPFVEDEPVEEIPVEEEPEIELTADYNPIASETFKEISGDVVYSKGPETIIADISKVMDEFGGFKDLDVVFAIDATGSMKNDIDKLKRDLQTMLQEKLGVSPTARVGLLFYRDYGDTFNYMDLPVKMFAFTSNLDTFNKNLNSVKIYGTEGGDIPEAVYEAMYASTEFFRWRPNVEKEIILIGDAEPHPIPRKSGKYSKEYVMNLAKLRGIKIHTILLPQD